MKITKRKAAVGTMLACGTFAALVAACNPSPPPAGHQSAPVPPVPAVPAVPAPPQVAPNATEIVEVFGTEGTEASLMVMSGGSSQNTVTVPHEQELPDGYVTVSVTRSPSVESYMNGGGPDSGEVGCRIVRDGKVIEQQQSSGEFASVTCSKWH